MAKRKDINIFDRSKKIGGKGRVSDIDYLDAFEQGNDSAEKEEVKTSPTRIVKKKGKQKEWVRHTFIIKPENIEELKDIVHTVKSSGEYQYSQKQALDDAIKLLKEATIKKLGSIKKFQ